MASSGKISMTLVLFTHSFPYGMGEYFLETEIRYLSDRFRWVIIVPLFVYGIQRPIPDGVTVDTSSGWPAQDLTVRRICRSVLSSARSPLFYQDIYARSQSLVQLKALRRLVGYLGKSMKVYKWLLSYIQRSHINIKDTLFYTYWLGPQSLAVGLCRSQHTDIKLISRVHGGDLYAERYVPPYLPLREITLRSIDRIFAISEHGRQYLTEKYPFISPRCEVSRIGVPDPGFSSSPSMDNVFRIVSCSSFFPVKRLDLLIESLEELTLLKPGLVIEWHHLGNGPLRKWLESKAKNILASKVHWVFHGWLPNIEVLEFYRRNNIDVFVNTSKSEGIPVSIMEAQSCGIPVIAPSVGGITEIIDCQNGILLEGSPTPQSVAKALEKIALHKNETFAKGIASKEFWRFNYNAERNYNAFLDRIIDL